MFVFVVKSKPRVKGVEKSVCTDDLYVVLYFVHTCFKST